MFESKATYAEYLSKKHHTVLLSKKQVCEELNVSMATLDRMRQQGEIISKLIRKQVRFHVNEVAKVVM